MKPVVTVTGILPEIALEKLKNHCDIKANDSNDSYTAEELITFAKSSSALITYLTDTIDKRVIEAGKDLKIIANYGAGYNNIDVACAKEKKIWVTNTPGVLHETTADLTWALILSVARRIVTADQYTRQKKFKGWGAKLFLGGDVYGKTLGVIGLGEIGRATARRAKGFSMTVLYHQRNRLPEEMEKELGAIFVSLDQLLKESDFITLHVPLTDQTHHMIGEKEFAVMKPTAYFIHTARGKVVDDKALVNALKKNQIAGAGLDVFENEPELEEGLTDLENIVILPHIGSASEETRARMAIMAVDNVLDALAGKSPRNLVKEFK
ncbi:MAG: 2-hydroxyacid dehydrogenase [Nitrospinales bacterium]